MEKDPSTPFSRTQGVLGQLGSLVAKAFGSGERPYWDASPDGGDWPARSKHDLSFGEVLEALDDIEDYVEPASASLKTTGAAGLRAINEGRDPDKTIE